MSAFRGWTIEAGDIALSVSVKEDGTVTFRVAKPTDADATTPMRATEHKPRKAFILDDRARQAACDDDPKFAFLNNRTEIVLTACGYIPAKLPVVLRYPTSRQLRQLALDLCELAEDLEHAP